MLQLDLIVVQQTLEEWVGRNREFTLMEEHEEDDVAIGQRRRILMVGHKPLHHIGPPMEKTMLDEALHVRMEGLVKRGLLRGRTDVAEWLMLGHEDAPAPPDGYVISFAPFHERGLVVPPHPFSGVYCTTIRSSCIT